MRISIPENFEKKLSGNYRSYIDNIISSYSSIIQDNKLEFFSEFTDHGLEHIEDVLNTASSLIDNKTLELLNTKDITVLIASIVLHDVGMHISSVGLKTILNENFDVHRIKYFDSKKWSDEWRDFIYEAKRFNDEQLDNIFGYSDLEIIEPDLDNLDDNSRKLCGEFIRRHHPRLAHEIAFSGFPSKKGFTNVIPASNIENEIIDLCGLVARSHGINLRNSFDYLKRKHFEAWKTPYDIKSVFLMVVLRISDYIQIHSERANPILVKTKRFSSPVSKMEWEKHDAIKYINIKTDDPERIYITSKPINSFIFLELKKLFKDIQYELDISWAVLGEVYGKDDELKELKIKYRRITSNLDDVSKFEKTVNFIPEKIRFDADPELLKLLIGPLYGEDPKYGVRELLQNAVDALKERVYVEKINNGKVVVELFCDSLNQENYFLTIKDNGIGMAKDTIIDFFFRAGASFRNSMLWKKSFVENSEVKIEKTGRFGVGVLAAFLLGEEFELYTRHFKATAGYYCKATLSTKQVELLKKDCEIGTIIKIKLNKEIVSEFNKLIDKHKSYSDQKKRANYEQNYEKNKLSWFNWYFMETPKIEYKIDDIHLKEIFSFKDLTVPPNPETILKGWYSFSTNEFKSIHWSMKNDRGLIYNSKKTDKLYCNGFKILRGYNINDFPWSQPIVSVFDGSAKMPLSLSRDYLLNDKLPFEQELVYNICHKIIQKLNETKFLKVSGYWVPKKNILEFINFKVDLSKFIIVKGDAFTILTPFMFQSLNIKSFYQFWIKNGTENNYMFKDQETFYQCHAIDNDPNYFYKNMLDMKTYGSNLVDQWFNLGHQYKGRDDILTNNYILNDKLSYMLEKNRLTKTFRDSYKSNLFNERWVKIKSYKKIDSYYQRNNPTRKKIEEEIKNLKEITKIEKHKLKSETCYFVKENYISSNELYSFDSFKDVWIDIFKKDNFLIPINEDFRIKI